MVEFEVNGQTYKGGRMSARTQFHVARRLAPVVASMGETLLPFLQKSGESPTDGGIDKVLPLLEPFMKAIGAMSDVDADYVLNACLGVVQRRNDNGTGWSLVMEPRSGGMMFQDIDMPTMLQIAFQVLRDNVSGFSFASLSGSNGQETATQAG